MGVSPGDLRGIAGRPPWHHHPGMESQAHADVPAVQVAARNGHRRALVAGARTALVMLVIAGAVMVGLGIVTRVLTDPPEVDGWLRSAFGSVFSTMALLPERTRTPL